MTRLNAVEPPSQSAIGESSLLKYGLFHVERMRILFFTTHQQSCGIGDYADRLAAALVAQGHEVTFFESPTRLVGQSETKYRKTLLSLKELALNHDVLHVQHEFSFFKLWQARLFGKLISSKDKRPYRTIITFHTTPKFAKSTDAQEGSLTRLFQKAFPKSVKNNPESGFKAQLKCFADFDQVLVHSRFGRNHLRNSEIFHPKRIRVIPMPIQAVTQQPAETAQWHAAVQKLDLRSGDKLIVVPGFISLFKGQLTAVKALSLLPPHYKMIIAGGVHPVGHNYQDLDTLTDEMISRNLQARIFYTGFLTEPDMNCLMSKSDLVALPYHIHYMSSSAVVGEALRFGKPVVATRTRGFLELSEIMSGVRLSDSASYADIARAIAETVQSPPGDAETIIKEAHTISYDVVAKHIVESFYAMK